MDFKIRTSPVEWGTKPYIWAGSTIYQCTWYVYGRSGEAGLPDPCYQNRGTKAEGYNNAKTWLDNFKEPWNPIRDLSYTPVKGDIAVFDGEYGHVVFFETDTMTSEYSSGNADSFKNRDWSSYSKSNLLGFLHLPYEPVEPVDRNPNVDQIETSDTSLRIRTEPSLEADIVGHVQIGYYNVLDQTDADSYTWYEIAKDRWCANITTKYLPADGDEDIIKVLEEYIAKMNNAVKLLNNENKELKDKMEQIHDLSEVKHAKLDS